MKQRSQSLNILYPAQPRGPGGERYCRRCAVELKGRRTAWCSEECCESALIESGHSSTIRAAVFDRDRGVCAACDLSTEELRRTKHPLNTTTESLICMAKRSLLSADLSEAWRFDDLIRRAIDGCAARFMSRRGFDLGISYWQADHIVPVAEGGGGCGLEGYRTLCVPCHKAETAELAKRLARKRSEARPLPLLDL